MRALAIISYTVGLVAAIVLALMYLTANSHLAFQIDLNRTVWSFVPMAALMCLVWLYQRRTVAFSWPLLIIVIVAIAALFESLVWHAFPEKAVIGSAAHLAIVVPAMAVIAWRLWGKAVRPLTTRWSGP